MQYFYKPNERVMDSTEWFVGCDLIIKIYRISRFGLNNNYEQR